MKLLAPDCRRMDYHKDFPVLEDWWLIYVGLVLYIQTMVWRSGLSWWMLTLIGEGTCTFNFHSARTPNSFSHLFSSWIPPPYPPPYCLQCVSRPIQYSPVIIIHYCVRFYTSSTIIHPQCLYLLGLFTYLYLFLTWVLSFRSLSSFPSFLFLPVCFISSATFLYPSDSSFPLPLLSHLFFPARPLFSSSLLLYLIFLPFKMHGSRDGNGDLSDGQLFSPAVWSPEDES